jgi:hypothetical protein
MQAGQVNVRFELMWLINVVNDELEKLIRYMNIINYIKAQIQLS